MAEERIVHEDGGAASAAVGASSLIQTIGRAARNAGGRVIMYADNITQSMERAIGETERRRTRQLAHNAEHGIDPQSIRKSVRDILADARGSSEESARAGGRQLKDVPRDVLLATCVKLEKEMKEAASRLEFEKAAALRDELLNLRKAMGGNESVLFQGRAPKIFEHALKELVGS